MNWKKYNWWLILIIALILRLWGYDKNPIGLVHDEIHQIVNAKSLLLTNREAAGTGAGIFNNLPYCDGNCVFGELPSYLLVPFAILPTVFPWVKLPFVLLSILMMYFGAKIFENITNNKNIGLLVMLLMAINPWSVNFGRTAYENLFCFTFYLLSLYLWTIKPIKIRNQILAIVSGFAASLSYFGAKPIFVPLMIVGLIYGWSIEKNNIKKYITMGMMIFILMIGYGIVLNNSVAGQRLVETKLLNNEIIAQVNEERRMSLEIPVVRDIFVNKYTVLFKILLKKYFGGLSPNYLFNEGEQGYDHFMIANHAFLYLIDLPLILFGLYLLAKKHGRGLLFVLAIIFILPITPTLSNYASTYALRSGLTYPIMAGLSGVGIFCIWEMLSKNKYKYWLMTILFLIYLISLVNFLVMYWYRNPFERGVGFVFHEREVSKYINLIKENMIEGNIEVTTNTPVDVIYEYALFTGKINNKIFVENMNEAIINSTYIVDGIKFSKLCPTTINNNSIYLWEREMNCVKEPNRLARISEPKDGGARYFIPNEKLCTGINLGAYPFPRIISDFNIEKMNIKDFCTKWISKP
jgi:hypothetical protein